jgi:hypothetical protein
VSSAQLEVNARHSATWAATLCHPQWASELGGGSRFKAAQFGGAGGRIESFFPSSSEVEVGSRDGFWEFMAIVRKVADLLGCPHAEGGANELLQADFGTLF